MKKPNDAQFAIIGLTITIVCIIWAKPIAHWIVVLFKL